MRFVVAIVAFTAASALAQTCSAATYTVTTFDVPRTPQGLRVTGINDAGQVVGTAYNFGSTGFIFSQASQAVTSFALPDKQDGATGGINNSGQVVTVGGETFTQGNDFYTSIYNSVTGTYGSPMFSFPSRPLTGGIATTGNNYIGQIVGVYANAVSPQPGVFLYPTAGFLFDTTTGGLTSLGAVDPLDINNRGEIVGTIDNGTQPVSSFVRDPISGGLTILNDPDAPFGIYATGINDREQVVGSYLDASHTSQNFLLDLTTGTYTVLSFPLAATTVRLDGINNSGQIAGVYTSNGVAHGFVATPVAAVPEPASLPLLGAAAGLMWTMRRRRRGGARPRAA